MTKQEQDKALGVEKSTLRTVYQSLRDNPHWTYADFIKFLEREMEQCNEPLAIV